VPSTAGLFYYEQRGDRTDSPPILFIHGAGGTHLNWPPQLRRMPGFRILAVDLPGHGNSGRVGKQRIADYMRCIHEFLIEMKIETALLVGHSMGSAIALTYAMNYPDRVAGLGLIGSGARLRVDPAILKMASNPKLSADLVNVILDCSYSKKAGQSLKGLARRRLLEAEPAVLYGDFQACDRFDIMDKLDEIQAPCLILCGMEDALTPLKYSEYLRDRINRSTLEVISGAGHMVMVEQPEESAEILKRFALTLMKKSAS